MRENQRGLEPLEPRALLAAVAWTGNTGDNRWETPENWSTHAVPATGDDVSILSTGATPITFTSAAGAVRIRSLDCRRPLTMSGGSLGIDITGRLIAQLTLAGATLTSDGNVSIEGAFDFGAGATLSGDGSCTTLPGVQVTLVGAAYAAYAPALTRERRGPRPSAQ